MLNASAENEKNFTLFSFSAIPGMPWLLWWLATGVAKSKFIKWHSLLIVSSKIKNEPMSFPVQVLNFFDCYLVYFEHSFPCSVHTNHYSWVIANF